uniref:Serpin domain-containing protein n=1 Tax=Stomoxys calcitrans TaxID=35570 RepID=A0A1I8QC09_STOCA
MKILQALLVLLGLSLCAALPTKTDVAEKSPTYASDASHIIATHLLKSYNDIDGNQVHSPLGVTTTLAILAEASQGATFDEFVKVLGYPKERAALRDSFKSILTKYHTKNYNSEPSFQSWLYIYRNFTAREDFKQMLQDYYFVDVKDINRDQYDWSEPNTSLDLEAGTTPSSGSSNSKDVIGFETLKRLKIDDEEEEGLALGPTTVAAYTDGYGEEYIEKETSKFDRYVDDKQYVEKPVIIEELKKEKSQEPQENHGEKEPKPQILASEDMKLTTEVAALTDAAAAITSSDSAASEKLESLDEKPAAVASLDGIQAEANDDASIQTKREDDLNLEENETVQDKEKILKNFKEAEAGDDKIIPIQEVLESNEPEKVTLPLQKLETVLDDATKSSPAEIMMALESHVSAARSAFGGRSLFRRDDIASALSANSITGRDIGSKTKMLLFNGLYYRGNWDTQFQEKQDVDEFFFMTAEDAMKTPMLHAQGTFHMAEMEHLNAKVLCLPYENKRYSMMIILPNELEGLHSLIQKLEPSDFKSIKDLMKERDLHVIMPKFQIEETSRSESMLKSLGLTKIFSRSEADLSLLSDDRDLQIDEIVQFVNVRVDEGGNSAISLVASNTEGRIKTPEPLEKFEITHPFLYFVMDCESEFILVSGKVHAPEVPEDLPVEVTVEFD